MKKVIFVFLFILCVTEISLRSAAGLYYSFHTTGPNKNDRDKVRILCMGESTTFGIGAQKGEDYPSRLNKLLDEKYPGRFIVYNRGVPGMTSSLMLLNLERQLREIRPHLVILLCGANEFNRRVNASKSLLIFETGKKGINNIFFNFSRSLRSFKTYRVLNFLKDNFKNRFSESNHSYINIEREYEDLVDVPVGEGPFRDLLAEQYKYNMKKITEFMVNKKIEIIYTDYLLPVATTDILKHIASKDNIVLCNQIDMLRQKGVELRSPDFYGLFSEDKFHPNKKGYGLMAEFLLKTLEDSGITQRLAEAVKAYERGHF